MKPFVKVLGLFFGLLLLVLFIVCERDRPVKELIPIYANSSSQFMSILGMQVHYRDQGVQSDSVPLILLHGMSSSLNTWDSVVFYLANHRRVISLDLPGFGLTGPSPENMYNFDYYNKFIDSFTRRLQLTKFTLVGNSMGGSIAWNYALFNPAVVDKLVLIDAAGYPKRGESGSLGFKIASTPVINNILLFATPKALVRKSLETIYFDQSRVTDAQVERFHDMAIREGNRAAALLIFKGSFGTSQFKGKIKEIKTPTLVLWGDKDNLISVENAYQFNQDIKGSKLEVYPNVGHVPMEEVPERVAKSILDFIG
ncbi:MAG: alpha/beta hydrolase [Terrimonas sp.]|jgi:pimeloyl-ACP methyl ester carboxylesterase|nr:alpha/beta hydrolase [Terrimonas sp.]